jgi:hypothetical protein
MGTESSQRDLWRFRRPLVTWLTFCLVGLVLFLLGPEAFMFPGIPGIMGARLTTLVVWNLFAGLGLFLELAKVRKGTVA